MNFIFNLLGPLVVIAVVAAVAVTLVAVLRRGEDTGDEAESGLGPLKRVFFYLLSFIALGVASSGITLLLTTVLDSLFGKPSITGGQTRIALALALTIVATPIWLLLWMRVQQAARQFPAEHRSLGRKLYIYLVLGVTAAVAAGFLVSLLRWIMDGSEFSGLKIAAPVVMAAIWAYHWQVEASEGQITHQARIVRNLYVYTAALYGLAMFATGVGSILHRFLLEAYDGLVKTQVFVPGQHALWTESVKNAIAMSLVGGAWWLGHWHRIARDDQEPGIRQVYLYLFAVLGGATTVVVSLAILLFGTLSWLLGSPGVERAALHFRFLPGVISGLVIGTSLWGYHATVIGLETHRAADHFQGARRVYQYLVSALGLATLAVGLVVLIGTAIGILAREGQPTLSGAAWWRSSLALGITLVAVGGPLWGHYWSSVQREVSRNPAVERTTASRRVFIYGVFCFALLTTLGTLSALLYIFLRDLLEGHVTMTTLQDVKWFIAALAMAGAISVYYWMVLQEDRRSQDALASQAPPVPASGMRRKRVTALVAPEAEGLVREIEQRLGYRIILWRSLADGGAPALVPADIDAVPDRITQAPGDRVLLIIDASGVRLFPYEGEIGGSWRDPERAL